MLLSCGFQGPSDSCSPHAMSLNGPQLRELLSHHERLTKVARDFLCTQTIPTAFSVGGLGRRVAEGTDWEGGGYITW